MLMHDWGSRSLVALAVTLTLILYLYVGLEPLLTPIILLACAVILRVFVNIRKVKVDVNVTPTEITDTVKYALLSLLALYVGELVVKGLYYPPIPIAVSSINIPLLLTCFVLLMAVAEELLFRGEFFDMLLRSKRVGAGIAIFLCALLFMLFHIPAYGTSGDGLLFVFLGGSTLSWAAWKTKRLLTPTIAHMMNQVVGTQLLTPILLGVGLLFVASMMRRRRATWWA